jgi:Mn2+/Fe2+ NRAMP family transporter
MSDPGSPRRAVYPIPGPGILIAVCSSGWVGLLSLVSFGADSGYAFLGITLITLIFKYCLITGLGRYTLATGSDIFAGLATLPGPANWAIWFVNIILYAEIFLLGFSALTLTRLCSELTGIILPPFSITIVIFALIFILISLDSYTLFRKILIRAIIFILVSFSTLILTMYLPIGEIAAGLIPDLDSYFGIYEASVILSSVGSGFSLLFYSVWMINHLQGRIEADEKKFLLRRIRIDAGAGMVILFVFCMIYYTIGFLFLYEHGVGSPEPDLTLGIVFTVLNMGMYENLIFSFICIIILFCSLFGGLYGRARVLEVTLPRSIPRFIMTRRRYVMISFCLVLSAISSDLFYNQIIAKEFLAIRLILFSMMTGLLMVIDSRLDASERGSHAWYGIMISGSILSLLIGLNLIGRFFGLI